MRESILRDFFRRRASTSELKADLAGTLVQKSSDVSHQYVEAMESEFKVSPEHLVHLCDAVLSGDLDATELKAIGFCIVSSDHFHWEADTPMGERVAETAYDWSSPETNYRLTIETVRKFRKRLLTGHNTLTHADHGGFKK